MTRPTAPSGSAQMNEMLRKATRHHIPPTAEAVLSDISELTAELAPEQLDTFRDALLDTIDYAATPHPIGA